MARSKITPSQQNLAASVATISTDQSTTSTSYADLATPGPAVTVNIGANGAALVIIQGGPYGAATQKIMSYAISGANTASPVDEKGVRNDNAAYQGGMTAVSLLTGLTAGSTTFTCKYKTASGTANFYNRTIIVIPL